MEAPRLLSNQAIEEFTLIYQAEFAGAISDAEATEMALRVLRLFEILARQPISTPSR